MAGRSALYCSGNFIVVTRVRAAVMASGEGVCADEAEIENRSRLATINGRPDMGSSNDGSRDENGFSRARSLSRTSAPFARTNVAKGASGLTHFHRVIHHWRNPCPD